MRINNDGKYIAQLNSMFLDVFGTVNAPIETDVSLQQSDDKTVRQNFMLLLLSLLLLLLLSLLLLL